MTISVGVLTYNQEAYIAETLDGILSQDTDDAVEIIICDDCSSDKTVSIIKEYQRRYNNIKLYETEINLGLIRNFKRLCDHLDGDFVAICAGDDYWHDKHKLRKQADFLKQELDYALVYTDFDYVDEQSKILMQSQNKRFSLHTPSGFILDDILEGKCLILPSTVMYRGIPFREARIILADCVTHNLVIEDIPLYTMLASKWKFKFLPDSTTSYRIVQKSLSRPGSFEKKIKFYEGILRTFFFLKEKGLIQDTALQYQTINCYRNSLKASGIFQRAVTGEEYYKKLKESGKNGRKDLLFYLASQYKPFHALFMLILRLRLGKQFKNYYS
ncbi:glycosyltransferase [Chitinophaga pendula]|uniref:glycosyltransferase n=1 Tax=Chitinophaga TaxID=79328 RepID=UPI000BAF8340|nr:MULTISPECIES: glycosyltransferase [Chitinophaga]ASZ10694.1 hypothetical protein CK934_06720 [Chitinophaga sp. MD30]UCJ06333.1 glycosyltransferase [Chitinophaga pendula]